MIFVLRRLLAPIAMLAWIGAANAGQDFFVTVQYHHVADDTPASTSVRIEQFERHLDYLADNGFTVVALDQALQALESGEALPELSVAITFDDSYRDIYDNAFTRLRERGWPFTVFINTAAIEEGQPWAMTWDQLREMQDHGALIANHSVSHPHFPRHAADDWSSWAKHQISAAGDAIERELGQRPSLFAWPYGEYSPAGEALLDELGLIGFGQHAGAVSNWENRHALPRFAVNARYARLDTLADKLHARPMPTSRVSPQRFVLEPGHSRPVLTLELVAEQSPPGGWRQAIQCFISGQGMVAPSWVNDQTLTLRAPKPLNPGRSRYTCTARAADGRYHWFSRQWLLPNADGSWPKE